MTGASKPGVMVYNSWATMQANGEKDADTCAYNDIALLKLDPADARERRSIGARLRRADGHGVAAVERRRRPSTRTATPSCAAA